jgi:hypothetical protein
MMEACLESKEPNPDNMEFEMEHREVFTEDAVVKPIEGQKRQRGQYLAAGDTDSQRK